MVVLLKNTQNEFFLRPFNRNKSLCWSWPRSPGNTIFANTCFQLETCGCQMFWKIVFPKFFQSSVKTILHKISRCETLSMSSIKNCEKNHEKSIFFPIYRNIFSFTKFFNPKWILLQPPVITDETFYTKIQNYFQKCFFSMFLVKKTVIIKFFVTKKRYSVPLEHQ